jgi:tRNA threonylcarbamoyl adenosine modification protein YjeE
MSRRPDRIKSAGVERAAMPEPKQSIFLTDEAATLALGARLAPHLRAGDVVALAGDLGAGKTTLVRGLIAELARRAGLAPETVPSPTFPLVQVYELGAVTLWHFDLYRLKAIAELAELGWEEALSEGITVVEWPERAAGFLPEPRLDIHLNWAGERRVACLTGRLAAASLAAILEGA